MVATITLLGKIDAIIASYKKGTSCISASEYAKLKAYRDIVLAYAGKTCHTINVINHWYDESC